MTDEIDGYLAEIAKPTEGSRRSGVRLGFNDNNETRKMRLPLRTGVEPNRAKLKRHSIQVLGKDNNGLAFAVDLAEAMAKGEGWEGIDHGLQVIIGFQVRHLTHFRAQLAVFTEGPRRSKPIEQHQEKAIGKAFQEARDFSEQLAATKKSARSFREKLEPQIEHSLVLAQKLKSGVGEKLAAGPAFL